MNNIELRYRQVHLDFHTSPDIDGVCAGFDAEEFASTLERARVNSVTCFARCHHGLMYYDSKEFPEIVHPKLKNKNLLRDQIEACYKRGIRVPIYTTVQWDDYMANKHPEWLAVDEKGNTAGWSNMQEPGFYRFLCLNSPYRDYLKKHTKELLDLFGSVDGLFFDILFLTDCSCRYCREGMERKGYNPVMEKERLKFASETLNEFMLEMTSFIRQYNKECSIFYNSSHVGPSIKERLSAYSHLEIESLPGGGWGYMHFPVTVRYARNLGLKCIGMTGKFHTEWGDFHSFKNKAALEYECFRMLALNSGCSVGDQLEPVGRLSKATYELIGSVYSSVEKKEQWCINAKAVADIGVFTPEEAYLPGQGEIPPAIMGVTRMLSESGHQYDIIDSQSDISGYRLLILPDNIPVSRDFANKLEKYINGGGALIASFESGLNEKKNEFELKRLPVRMKDPLTCDIFGEPVKGKIFGRSEYADYLLPKGDMAKGLPETEHVMYMKGLEVDALPGSEILADAILPYFNRTYKHFCSHRQTPSSGNAGYAGVVKKGPVIYFAHPVFAQYCENSPRWCKQLVCNAINVLMGESVLQHNGPSTILATLNEQTEENRWIAHLLHYIPERRCEKMDIIEDIIPLYNIKVSVKTHKNVKDVQLVPEMKMIDYVFKKDRVEFVVPEINGHQMISINFL